MRFLLVAALCLLFVPALAQQRFVVAVVGDGPTDRFANQQEKYVDELLALTANEFDVELRPVLGDWSKDSIDVVLDSVYADPSIDLVLINGFVANQVAATRREFSKPTFLPLIIDIGLLEADAGIGRSGIENLNYLSAYADFTDDLDTLARIVPYRTLVLMVDEALSSAIPELREAAFAASEARGIELIEVTHDGIDHRLMNRVPAETDAIFLAGLPRMPLAEFDQLIAKINAAGLPSYSFAGVADVERGLLVTNSEPRDVDRQARLNALNMQAVMLGARAEDQPTASQNKEQLTINMETARKINLSPSFEVLGDAVLLNQQVQVSGKEYGLVEIARLALDQNQDLQAEIFGVRAGLEEIARARSSLLPQIDASTTYTTRNDTSFVKAGLFAEHSTDAAVSVDQLLYSDAASANLVIQRELQRTRMSSLQEFRLDVVQAATTA